MPTHSWLSGVGTCFMHMHMIDICVFKLKVSLLLVIKNSCKEANRLLLKKRKIAIFGCQIGPIFLTYQRTPMFAQCIVSVL